jgi:RNA polymerase sigma-70 factor (ECF subfamily)
MAHPDYSALLDDELVKLCQIVGSKDDRPFAELFRRHRQYIWRTCYSFFANAEDAEDLTQEVFFRAYRRLSSFERRAAFKTWLHRIAINICLNELRSRRRRPPLYDMEIEELSETLPGADLNIGYAESLFSKEQLRTMMAGLRTEDQEALYLREVEDYSFGDIAKFLGIGLSAAKMRVYRTRLALQKAFAEIEQEEMKT